MLNAVKYFDTNELAEVPEDPQTNEVASNTRDLAFLGYTFKRSKFCSIPYPRLQLTPLSVDLQK